MSSKRELILAQVETVLKAVTELATDTVYRSRKAPTRREEGVVVIIEPGKCIPDTSMTTVIDWSLTVNLILQVRSTTPDSDADDFINKIHTAMMADTSLGGLSQDIQVQMHDFEFYDADLEVGIFPLSYLVNYRTTSNDLTT
jgi:hypothetical protein